MRKSSTIFLLFSLLFLLNCVQYTKYIPDPEKDIKKWIDNFDLQRSFSYQYRLQTKTVYTEAQGDCVIGRGEHIHGMWHYSDSKLKFEYIGLGDIEYSKKNGKWQRSSRGEESNILAQIKRLLKFDKFEYIGSEKEFLYRFKANIPFLAPGRWKEMVGFIKISKRYFLPEVIWAGLPDSSVYWEIKLSKYNKKKRIKSPVDDWNNYSLIAAGDYLKRVKRRLKLIDIDYRIKKKGEDIIVTMPKQYTVEGIKTMFSSGILNVYGLTQRKDDATKIAYLKDNIKKPLFLTEKLLDQHDIKDAKIKFDEVSRSYIQISLKKKFILPSAIAFELDGTILGIATLDTLRKIDKIRLYTDMQYYDIQIIRASLLQSLPSIDIKSIVEELN